MRIDTEDFKNLLRQLADTTAQDGLDTGTAFWNRMKGDDGRIESSKAALARYAQHNLNALAMPASRDAHLASAAHDLNTLINIGAATQIEARREARAFLDRVMVRLFNAAEAAIDILL